MAKAIRDRFANIASIEVTQAAANAESFASLATNMGFLGRRDQALAMVIDEIDWYPLHQSIALMTAASDFIILALTVSNQISDLLDLTDRRILANFILYRQDLGTAASGGLHIFPSVKQFFPPLISAERTLYLGIDSGGLATVATGQIRILYRVETLSAAELIELAETFRLTG